MCSLCLETNVELINNICQDCADERMFDWRYIELCECHTTNQCDIHAKHYLDTTVELGYSETS